MGMTILTICTSIELHPQVPILPAGDDGDRSSGTPSDLADELLRGFEIGVSRSLAKFIFPVYAEGGNQNIGSWCSGPKTPTIHMQNCMCTWSPKYTYTPAYSGWQCLPCCSSCSCRFKPDAAVGFPVLDWDQIGTKHQMHIRSRSQPLWDFFWEKLRCQRPDSGGDWAFGEYITEVLQKHLPQFSPSIVQ